jgi:hypothetical protein
LSDEERDEKDLKLTDLFRKVVSTGIGAAFMTEDAVKGIIQDLPLPKDIINGLLQNARQSKEEFIKGVKEEIKGYLTKVNVRDEIENVINNYDIEVSAKFNFIPKDKDKDKDKDQDQNKGS